MELEDIARDISVERAWSHIEHITQHLPSRLAGSENSRQMAEYAHYTFVDAGLDSRLHEFSGLVSFPDEAAVRVLQPEQRDIVANTLGHSVSIDGIEGELVYVGSGAESEYEGKDVRGKITLSELSYSPARHEKALIAEQRGSIAQIMMNWGDEANEAVPFGSIKSAWGNPTPETLRTEMPGIPCVGVARTEGLRLRGHCENGAVRVWLSARADNGWRQLTMTSAEFGADSDREFLLLGGHIDSWFGPQATDNAAGTACILELSRAFGRHQDELRRGLLAGLWMGHETGTMVSSSRFADVNWERLRRNGVAYLQIDQPAMTGTSTWHLHSTDEVQRYLVQATRSVVGNMPIQWKRMRKTGDTSFYGVGLPNVSGVMSFTDEEIERTALANLGWWHHSRENTLDKLNEDLLALHLNVYARWIWDLLTDPILPFEYALLAARFVERVYDVAQLDVPDIDMTAAVTLATVFQQLVEQFDRLTKTLRQQGTNLDDEAVIDLVNHALMRLSRTLVPLAYTVVGSYGQDRYGHSWQSRMIPCLTSFEMASRYPPDSEQFQVWWVEAIRARNRVLDAIDDASVTIRGVLSELRLLGPDRGDRPSVTVFEPCQSTTTKA